MTPEEKQLLLKDLCARLPYHTIVEYRGAKVDLTVYARSVKIMECKPYLRPMSSMTKKEKKEIDASFSPTGQELFSLPYVDWLIARHFDYRGLIPKGLALEAPEGMYKTE